MKEKVVGKKGISFEKGSEQCPGERAGKPSTSMTFTVRSSKKTAGRNHINLIPAVCLQHAAVPHPEQTQLQI